METLFSSPSYLMSCSYLASALVPDRTPKVLVISLAVGPGCQSFQYLVLAGVSDIEFL